MPAAVYRAPGEVPVEQRPVPSPAAGQLLVEVSHCGVCGSDIHLMVEGWGRPGLVGGHEYTGTVVALGDGVSGWRVGDLVVGGPSPRCGKCRRCVEGKPSQCERRGESVEGEHDGAFARYVLVGGASAVKVPDGVSLRAAALAEPLAVALHGITRSGLAPGDSAMVFGTGPIGALSIAALVAKGIGPVTAVEPSDKRREIALALGADEAVDPSELESYPRWEPSKISPRAVDAVLECSGKKAAIELALNQLRRGGRLVMVGAGMDQPSLDPNRVLLNELEICGSFIYDADGFDKALELIASGAIPTEVLIEPRDVPLDLLAGALGDLATGNLAGKVMVVPRTSKEV
jgi:(R,R)-butanediol dehydrogenase / meso-butanediol dehydrogenase / diacetyl reductase